MKRSLGVDYGTKRVGLAISDSLGMVATPLTVLERQSAVDDIVRLVQDRDVDTIVVGLPTGLDGTEGQSARDARNLGDELKRQTGVEIVFRDERFTSRMAENALLESGMRRRDRRITVDKVAASIILQDYLDSQT